MAKNRTDAERIDLLQAIMTPDDNYCEVYFAGLRDWSGNAVAFQVESNPEKFPTANATTLREAIDKALDAIERKSSNG